VLAALLLVSGCTTDKAKKAMERPVTEDAYTNPGPGYTSPSERTAATHTPVGDEMAPEEAVTQLVSWLKKDRSYQIPAEEQLARWGRKQGVPELIVRKVRPLLKDARIDVRAPALRLTVAFCGPDSAGDLIECLADSEYGMRETAFKALKERTQIDFGYGPSDGDVARAQSLAQWREWWQERVRSGAAHPPADEVKPDATPKKKK
jgi:hypothetical protein